MSGAPTPEWSRPVPVARIRAERAVWRVEANADERAALARRFELEAIDRLAAEIGLARGRDGTIVIDGTVSAALTQTCAVTLDPVPALIDEPFRLQMRPGIDEDEADRLSFEDPSADLVEPLVGDAVDLGELAAQYMALALDPFPRAPGLEPPDGPPAPAP